MPVFIRGGSSALSNAKNTFFCQCRDEKDEVFWDKRGKKKASTVKINLNRSSK